MESDPNAKLALEKKIREIQQVHQLDLNSDMIQEQEEQEDEEMVRIRRELSAALHDCLPRANEKTDDERYVVL